MAGFTEGSQNRAVAVMLFASPVHHPPCLNKNLTFSLVTCHSCSGMRVQGSRDNVERGLRFLFWLQQSLVEGPWANSFPHLEPQEGKLNNACKFPYRFDIWVVSPIRILYMDMTLTWGSPQNFLLR